MLSVTTWNVNGIRARKDEVPAWIEQNRPGVLYLQELKAAPEKVPESLACHPDYWCYWHGHKGYSGVALLFSKALFPARPSFTHPAFDHETRIVTAAAGEILFASVYVPNGGKDFPAKMRFLEAMDQFVAATLARGQALLLCGDLNVAREPRDVHPILQKPNLIGTRPEERQLFERILSHGLTDLLRQFQPNDDRLFTWWAPWRNMRQKNIGWRLDYVLASPPLADCARACSVDREFGTSDHGPVTAIFDWSPSVTRLEPEPPARLEPEPPPESVASPQKGQLELFSRREDREKQ
jgi:exodeoxyribonuclease-3